MDSDTIIKEVLPIEMNQLRLLKMFGKKKLIDEYFSKAEKYVEVTLAALQEKQKKKIETPSVTPEEQSTKESGIRFSIELSETPPEIKQRDPNVRYSIRSSVDDSFFFSEEGISIFSEEIDGEVQNTFVDCLLKYIDGRNVKDSYIYKAAGLDRRLYSKIVSDRNYKPSKDTCIALCLALKLHKSEFDWLLAKAGYTLSDSIKRDIVIEFFVKQRFYDVNCINGVLEKMNLKPLNR